jgi:hypothetical protein
MRGLEAQLVLQRPGILQGATAGIASNQVLVYRLPAAGRQAAL